ncbi:MAG: serine/threonine-protein kinase [Mycoplasma sp.]
MKYKIGDVVSGYKVVRELSGGGMSDVYLAQNIGSVNNPYAIIKVISKESIIKDNSSQKAADDQWRKALDEFTLTWAIFEKPNENIAKPIKWSMNNDKTMVSIVTEYINGPSLSKLISNQKALPIDRAMFYFKQICNGVKHLHHLNEKKVIIHRDLKSENIMLSKDLRQLKIIDYGIATIFYDNAFESGEGTVYCTANYTTPDILQISSNILNEASKGDQKAIKRLKEIITPQFDFHALGVILYEMIIGAFPFTETKEENDREKIKKWLKYDIPVISNIASNVPSSIDNIIFRLTASGEENKKHRYKSIDEIIEDVKTWDDEIRKNEILIKPIEKRNFQQARAFDVSNNKNSDKFYDKWWFFVITNASILAILIIIITVLFTKN